MSIAEEKIKEEYDPDGSIFYCHMYKGYVRSSGCRYRAQKRMNNGLCSTECKQAIKEGVFKTKIKRRKYEKAQKYLEQIKQKRTCSCD